MSRESRTTASLVGIALGLLVVTGAALVVAGCGGGSSGGVIDNGPDPTGAWVITYQDIEDTCDGTKDQFEETWKIRRSGSVLCISALSAASQCVPEFCDGRYANGDWNYQDTITNATSLNCTETISAAFNLHFTSDTVTGTYSSTAHYVGTCPLDCGQQRSVTGVRCTTDCWATTGCP